MSDNEEVAKWCWVLERTEGDRAKSIQAHADAGMTYYVVDQGRAGNKPWVLAAFKRMHANGPLSPHLQIVTDAQMIASLNRRDEIRHPSQYRQTAERGSRASAGAVRDVLEKRKATLL